jgi:hypothetical protein
VGHKRQQKNIYILFPHFPDKQTTKKVPLFQKLNNRIGPVVGLVEVKLVIFCVAEAQILGLLRERERDRKECRGRGRGRGRERERKRRWK